MYIIHIYIYIFFDFTLFESFPDACMRPSLKSCCSVWGKWLGEKSSAFALHLWLLARRHKIVS